MDFLYAVIFGLVEGITEFLPVSSTGHLVLTAHLLGIRQTEFAKNFEITIQLGAILAVVVLYAKPFLLDFKVLWRLFAAFVPTAILGLLLYKVVKHTLLNQTQVILWSLFLGGVTLIVFEIFHKEKENALEDVRDISWWQCLAIGVVQSLAIIPGVSRSAATVVGGLGLGLKRKTILQFSFLLAVPTMFAATTLDLFKSDTSFSSRQWLLLGLGFLVSFVVAIFAIQLLSRYIKHHNFVIFGVYRIAISLLFWFVIR